MKLLLSMTMLLSLPCAYSMETFKLSEKSIIKLIENSPNTDQIKATLKAEEFKYRSTKENFKTSLNASTNYQYSDDGILNSLTQTSRINTQQIGVQKVLPKGISVGVDLQRQEIKSGSTVSANSKVIAKLGVDLYKDFLGRTTGNQLKEAKINYEVAKFQEKIDVKDLKLEVLKLYWNFVALTESRKVSQKLLKSAQNQLKVVKEKVKNDVADRGDIARFNSVINERNSQITQYDGDIKQLEIQLKRLFPELAYKKIELQKFNLTKAVSGFYMCLNTISAQKTTPYNYSYLTEIVELKKKLLRLQKERIAVHAGADVKLNVEAGYQGDGDSFSNAQSNLSDETKNYHAAGISFSFPLDSTARQTKKAQLRFVEANLNAQTRGLKGQMDAYHSTIVESIELLKTIIKQRSENDDFLLAVLKNSRKKYRQARLTSFQLLEEEDRYIANAISLINTQIQLVNVMYDYFGTFTKTPCALNEV